jgi:hypothetical protein
MATDGSGRQATGQAVSIGTGYPNETGALCIDDKQHSRKWMMDNGS